MRRTVLGLLITGVLLWWLLKGVDLVEVWSEIRNGNFWLLGLAVAIATGTFFLRALRWKVLLDPSHSGTSLRSRWAAVNIGFMANNLLPARLGEFVRAYALARLEPIPVSGAFGSLVVERFLDGLIIVLFLFVAMAAPGFPAEGSLGELAPVAQGVALTLLVLLLVMVLLLLFPRTVVGWAERIATHLPQSAARLVVDALEAFLDGLKVFQKPGPLLVAFLWSVVVWAWQTLAFWVGFRAFGIDVGYDTALFVNSAVAFAVSLPAAPGFFGTFHLGVRLGLGVYGIPAASTLAFAFGFHLGGFIPVTLIGLYYATRLGISVEEMGKSEETVEEAVERRHPEPIAKTLEDGPDGDFGG